MGEIIVCKIISIEPDVLKQSWVFRGMGLCGGTSGKEFAQAMQETKRQWKLTEKILLCALEPRLKLEEVKSIDPPADATKMTGHAIHPSCTGGICCLSTQWLQPLTQPPTLLPPLPLGNQKSLIPCL